MVFHYHQGIFFLFWVNLILKDRVKKIQYLFILSISVWFEKFDIKLVFFCCFVLGCFIILLLFLANFKPSNKLKILCWFYVDHCPLCCFVLTLLNNTGHVLACTLTQDEAQSFSQLKGREKVRKGAFWLAKLSHKLLTFLLFFSHFAD